jgi:hypothetical protein
MKISFQILIILFLQCCVGKREESLSFEMKKMDIDTVLAVSSNSIDEYPLWSPDSNTVAVNIEGEWHKFDLLKVRLSKAIWHGKEIGVINKLDSALLMHEEQKKFYEITNYNPRLLTNSSGDKVELRLKNLSTSLIITRSNNEPEVLWKTALENCHSLSISPDENFVAFLCELNGLFVMKLR